MAGKAIDNGLGFRIQDSVPANYWTPLATFGNNLYNEVKTGTFDKFRTDGNIRRTTNQLAGRCSGRCCLISDVLSLPESNPGGNSKLSFLDGKRNKKAPEAKSVKAIRNHDALRSR
jgi:hypothetical protein